MFAAGLVDEVSAVRDHLCPEAAQAVGYKEVIRYLDGAYDLEHAIYQVSRVRGCSPNSKPPGTDVFMIFAGYPAMPTTCSSAP